MSRKNKKERNIFGVILGIIIILMTLSVIYLLKLLDVLNDKYFSLVCILLGVITLITSIILFIKIKKKRSFWNSLYRVFRVIAFIISFVLMFCYGYLIYYLNQTMNFLDNIKVITEEVTDYYIVVLKDSRYQDVSDLDGLSISYFDMTDSEVIDAIKLDIEKSSTNDLNELKESLFNDKVASILISDPILNRYQDEDSDFDNKIRIIDTISIKSEIVDITKKVSIKNTPFNILISGIDTEGNINKKSRNDVNIVATVNPNTNKILLTSIPRDYYVKLRGKTGNKDKLTHASYYGIDCAVGTIEDILDIDINYYIKVNFTTVIDLVNALGGVTVYSDQNVKIYTGKKLKKGYNTLNGEEALAFARERHAYSDGDNHRGRNQQEVIRAIFEKVTSGGNILTEYTNILEAMDGKFATNMDMDQVLSFVKYELDELSSYSINSIQLKGRGSMGETYSYPGQNLWIMIPNKSSITKAHDKITALLNE